MTLRVAPLAVLLFALLAARPAAASGYAYSRLALPLVAAAPASTGPVAQRVIDREWGPSDDSLYRVVDIPGWKSEGLAMGLSGALPGAGQLYAGDNAGWLYLVAEAAGWTSRVLLQRRADRDWGDLVRKLGDPNDSTATFSFARYEKATGDDASLLRQLWAGDREAFYRELHRGVYREGFGTSSPSNAIVSFTDQLDSHDTALTERTAATWMLWLNHLVAAADALRAARVHNLPLRENYHLDVSQHWRHGRPELRAAVVRSF